MKKPKEPKLLKRITGKNITHDLAFYCVGCDCLHSIRTRGFFKQIDIAAYPPEIKEQFKREHFSEVNFNNNFNLPSVKDAILNIGEKGRCHLLIKKARLTYLSDTTTGVAGRSFNMVEL